jgi:Zn-dependent peptidase ImmA (M78 family)/transcriptional regulator with XRE-family HTH domain
MALTPVEIGRRIRRVRTETGISAVDFAAALGVAEMTVSALEEGRLEPVPGDYVLIAARLFNTDFRYFISDVLDDVEAQSQKLFRALSNLSPQDLLAIRRFLSLCLRESELESLLGRPPSRLPPTYPRNGRRMLHKEQGPLAAREERQRLQLDAAPVPNVFAVLRAQGIRLFRHRLVDTELSGVTVLHPKAGVCVLINYDDDLYRQFFSAAHEYGHVLFDRTDIEQEGHIVSRYKQSELREIRCNTFAAEFLLPGAALGRYRRPRDRDEVRDLLRVIALDYRVNTETVAIRMKEEAWITDRTLQSFQQRRPVTIPRREKSDPDLPANLTPVQTERRSRAMESGFTTYFLELLRGAMTQGEISQGRFAEMLDMDQRDARDFASEIGLAL